MTFDIMLEGSQATPSDLAFNLAIAWRDYRLAQDHLHKIQLHQSETTKDDHWNKLLGTKHEIQQALVIQKRSLQARIHAYQKIRDAERKCIPTEWQRECDSIILIWEREQELLKLYRTPNRERNR